MEVIVVNNNKGAASVSPPSYGMDKGAAPVSPPWDGMDKGTAPVSPPWYGMDKGAAPVSPPWDGMDKGTAPVGPPSDGMDMVGRGPPNGSAPVKPPSDRMEVVVQSNKSNAPVALTNRVHRDPIFGSPVMRSRIHYDLLLLENQLPFKVLHTLYNLTLAKILPDNLPNGCRSLTHFVRMCFGDVMGVSNLGKKNCSSGDSSKINEDDEKQTVENFHHLLHVVHNRYLPPEENRNEIGVGFMCSGTDQFMRSATDLDFAGVKFKARVAPEIAPKKEKEKEKEVPSLKIKCHDAKGIFWWCRKEEKEDEKVHLLNIKFYGTKGIFWWCRKAPFEIPVIVVTDATERFLRNLIAFEYCCPEVGNHFTWYAVVMDRLIDSEDDVKVLERDKVLYNCLGNRKVVANMFNKLCNEVSISEKYFIDDCHRAVDHSKKCHRQFMARLRRKWFDSPWTFIAFVVAAIAFGITITRFVQSFFG
ncbi:hypothetical protein U1Q18_013538 [Sarracenia purpurea var. burkii]